MRRTILVPGTWSYDGTLTPGGERADWFHAASPFSIWCRRHGLDPQPFTWNTDVGGIGFGDGDLRDWRAAGMNLLQMAVPPFAPDHRVPGDELIVIAHSHGGQVALAAAAAGLKIALLITVCMPVRSDMWAVAEQGRPHIQRWVHLHGGGRDRWQWRGSLFDSWDPRTWFRVQRKHTLADVNRGMSEADHDDYLRDPHWFYVMAAALVEAPIWPRELEAA